MQEYRSARFTLTIVGFIVLGAGTGAVNIPIVVDLIASIK